MKLIILISSIFYILGLKLSHKFELVKKTDAFEKVITITMPATKSNKTLDISGELKAKTDSVNINGSIEKQSENEVNF